MNKKETKNFKGWNARRRISRVAASVLVFVFVFEQILMSLSYAAAADLATASDAVRSGYVSAKSIEAKAVELAVLADDSSMYEAGGEVSLDVYIKSNTDQEIFEGLLEYEADGILEESVYVEDMGTVYPEDMEDELFEGEEDELALVSNMVIASGAVRHVRVSFTLSDETEEIKKQKVTFSFKGSTMEGKVSAREDFCYTAGGMNLLPVEIGEDGRVEAGEESRMRLDFDLGEIQSMIQEREELSEDGVITASASDATPSSASPSNAGTGNPWIRWKGEKDSGRKEEKPIIKELECSVETKGLKFKEFKTETPEDDRDISAVCTFVVDEETEPGIYFGQVTATYKIKSSSYKTTQGMVFEVANDGAVMAQGLDPEVLEVIRLIDELPELEEVAEKLAALEDAGDDEGYFEYVMEICELVMPVWEKYQALTEEQKEQVTNREKLEAFSVLWEIMLLAGEYILMATYPRNNDAWKSDQDKNALKTTTVDLKGGWKKKGNSVTSFHGIGWWVDNEVAYCIEPGVHLDAYEGSLKPNDEKDTDSLNSTQKKLIGRIISAGGAYKGGIAETSWTPANDKDKICKIIAAQLLVWEVVVGERDQEFKHVAPPAGKNKVLDSIDTYSASWKKKVNAFYEEIEEDVRSVSKEPTLSDTELVWNKTEGRYQAVLEDKNGVLANYTVKVKVGDTQKNLKDGKTVTVDGISCTRSGDKIIVYSKTRPATKKTLSIEAERTVKRAGFVVWSDGKYGPNISGNKQDVVSSYKCKTVSDKQEKQVKVSIAAAKKTDITLQKKDVRDNTVLNGATFTLSKVGDNTFAQVQTTTGSGTLRFTGLGVGAYKLEETKAPVGYQKGPNIEFHIVENTDGSLAIQGLTNAQASGTTITVTNQELSKLTVKKTVDVNETSSESPSENDQFTITVTFGTGGGSSTTASVALGQTQGINYVPNGRYTLKLGKDASVIINNIPAGTTYTVTESPLTDKPGYSFVNIATDKKSTNHSVNGQALRDTVDGDHKGGVNETVTVANRYFKSREIRIDGEKYWKESHADGTITDMAGDHEVLPESVTVVLYQTGKNGQKQEIGRKTVTKADDWKYSFTNLPEYENAVTRYTYSVEETMVQYKADDPRYRVESEDGTRFQVYNKETGEVAGEYVKSISGRHITNTWYPANTVKKGSTSLVVRKANAENHDQPLAGVTFELAPLTDGAGDGSNTQRLTTDEHGEIMIEDLAEGKYLLTEIEAPPEYEKLAESWNVTVSKELTKTANGNTWTNTWTWTLTVQTENAGDMYQWTPGNPEEDQINQLAVYNAPVKGQISIAKQVRLDDEVVDSEINKEYVEKTFRFDIYKGTEITGDPIRLTVRPDGKAVTTEPLYYGMYTIVEADQDMIGDYTWIDLSLSGEDSEDKEVVDADPDKEGFQVEITRQNQIIAVTAVNQYVRNTADLDFVKTVEFNSTTSYRPDADQEFEFQVKFGEGEAADEPRDMELTEVKDETDKASANKQYTAVFDGEGTYSWSMKADEKVTITGIPTEMNYRVVELPVRGGDGEPDERYTFDKIVSTTETNPENVSQTVDGKLILEGVIPDNGELTHTETVSVTNHFYDRRMITIEGEKTWKDGNDQAVTEDGLLPRSIEIALMRRVKDSEPETEAEVVDTQTVMVDSESRWRYSFAAQPRFADENAEKPYEYFVVETDIQYGEADAGDTPYIVEPMEVEGRNMFKISEKKETDGFHQVLGVFEVAYEVKGAATKDHQTVQEIVINNTWKAAVADNQGDARLNVAKVDSQDKKPLAGAMFQMMVNDVLVIHTTDEEGKLTFENLPVGIYQMTEAASPAGYQKRDTQWTVTVSRKLAAVRPDEEDPSIWINQWQWTTEVEGNETNGSQLTVENDRIQGYISISKTLVVDERQDTNPDNRQKEYTFGIYQGNTIAGAPAATLTVRADGQAKATGLLDCGVYTVKEIQRSDIEGYVWTDVTFEGVSDVDEDADGLQVMIGEQGEILAVRATNYYEQEEEETTSTTKTETEPEESSGEEETESSSETDAEEGDPESSSETDPEESQPESSSQETTAPEESSPGQPSTRRPGGGGNRNPGPIEDNPVPLAHITSGDIPLANVPDEPVVIMDEEVPLAALPKMGDHGAPLAVLMSLMIVSILGALGITRKRKEEENS